MNLNHGPNLYLGLTLEKKNLICVIDSVGDCNERYGWSAMYKRLPLSSNPILKVMTYDRHFKLVECAWDG